MPVKIYSLICSTTNCVSYPETQLPRVLFQGFVGGCDGRVHTRAPGPLVVCFYVETRFFEKTFQWKSPSFLKKEAASYRENGPSVSPRQ